jgi:hypothetical protein
MVYTFDFYPSNFLRTLMSPQGAIVTWQDLKCGEVLKVYGRSLLLISADAQTTEWYKRNHTSRVTPSRNEEV